MDFSLTVKLVHTINILHPIKGRVTVSFHHPGDTFPLGTLKGIIQDAGWTEDDLKRLRLLK